MIITIDGAVATGKSTVAKKLAHDLGFVFFDTGAMYRSFTYLALKHNIDTKNSEQLEKLIASFDYDIRVRHGEKHYFAEGEDVTKKIRDEAVTAKVSEVAAIPEVRKKLVTIQRELASGVNAVFEGRDMGTVVFPDADLKIFLTGDVKVRAKRRYEELISRNLEESANISLEKVTQDLIERDERDSNRKTSPLKEATDSIVVDTTGLSVDEVVLEILEHKDALKKKPVE